VLVHRAREHDVKTILVTGPGQGEGKSTTTANLGVVLARSGYRVAMLSCDLRKPALHRLFGLPSEPGLADVLQHKIALRDALIRTGVPNLLLLPSGVAPANPSELLGSGAMAAVVTELRANADFLLLDTPPSLVVGDALELAPIADAVLVVVDGSATTEANVVRWRAQLDQVGGHLLGCVLNNLDPKAVARYGSYYSAAYRYGGPPTGGRRREDREREGWGRLGTFPPGASEVNVSLGPAFAGFDENANGRGSGPPPEMPEPETVPKLDGVGDGDGEPRPS
jgi:capsular exopolysaccharide synthesis family protein